MGEHHIGLAAWRVGLGGFAALSGSLAPLASWSSLRSWEMRFRTSADRSAEAQRAKVEGASRTVEV